MERIKLYMNLIFNRFSFLSLVSVIFIALSFSCEDFVNVNPPNSKIVSKSVFSNDETATAAVTGIYHQMMASGGFASGYFNSVTLLSGMSSDELDSYTGLGTQFAQNELTAINAANLPLWSTAYNTIYQANAVMEGLANSVGVTDKIKTQLEGEARFIRAFTYFYLVNLYGDVPFISITDYRQNYLASRTSVAMIYDIIVADLLEAKSKLGEEYATTERVRVNKFTASALLARVYLYLEKWTEAESESTIVINNSSTYELSNDLDNVFFANSMEAIWQLAPVGSGNTFEGNVFILTGDPVGNLPAALSDHIVNAFEPNDLRFTKWVGSYDNGSKIFYYPYKYKVQIASEPATEYSMVLRLSEQYLIRAEARAQLGNLSGAITDIDMIRLRAGLPLIVNTTPSIDQGDLLLAIEHERQVELFAEWGHRWLDLKRTGRASTVLGNIKPEWDTNDVLYPIPQSEMNKAPNLKPQNPGY